MATIVVAYELGDSGPQRRAVEREYIRQGSQHLYLPHGRICFVSNQVIYGFKHNGRFSFQFKSMKYFKDLFAHLGLRHVRLG
jgi:hypothetical protein